MTETRLRPSVEQLTAARSRVVVEVLARFPLSAAERATPPAAPSEPRVVKDTEFTMDADGRIVGKREVSHVETPAPPAPPEVQMPAALAGVPFLDADELRAVSSLDYARQVRPGVVEFDWSVVERSIGRNLNVLDLRVLRAAVPEPDPSDLAADRRLAALRARLVGRVV